MNGQPGPLLPAGNTQIGCSKVFQSGTVLAHLMRKNRCFWVKNGVKMIKKQSFLRVLGLKNSVFGLKTGFERANMGCNNRVFECFLAVFRGKIVSTVSVVPLVPVEQRGVNRVVWVAWLRA